MVPDIFQSNRVWVQSTCYETLDTGLGAIHLVLHHVVVEPQVQVRLETATTVVNSPAQDPHLGGEVYNFRERLSMHSPWLLRSQSARPSKLDMNASCSLPQMPNSLTSPNTSTGRNPHVQWWSLKAAVTTAQKIDKRLRVFNLPKKRKSVRGWSSIRPRSPSILTP
jgi:hypothetical protein